MAPHPHVTAGHPEGDGTESDAHPQGGETSSADGPHGQNHGEAPPVVTWAARN